MRGDKRAFVTVAVPRSGTNYFQDAISAFGDIAGLMELFNAEGAYGLAKYPRLLASFGDMVDDRLDQSETLVRHFAHAPLSAIDTLSRAVGADPEHTTFSFKVFPRQISDDVLDQIILRHAAGVIVLVRPRLDVFASYKKAVTADVWHTVDTSRLKVNGDLAEFHEMSRDYDHWYDRVERFLLEKRVPHTIFSYRADINVATDVLIEKIYYALRSMHYVAALPHKQFVSNFRRQDTREDVFDKFRNGRQLKAELARSGLLEYALSCPLSD